MADQGGASKTGKIEVKIQCDKRKLAQKMIIKPNSPFVIMMVAYAEKIGVGWAKLDSIKFVFNGTVLDGLETPKDFGFKGGECIDAHISVVIPKTRQGSKKD